MSSTAPSGTPVGHSTTAGCLADPLTLSSTVPGSSGTPTEANRSGPSSASTATWANVDALDNRVGRSSTPLSAASVLRPRLLAVDAADERARLTGDEPLRLLDHAHQ